MVVTLRYEALALSIILLYQAPNTGWEKTGGLFSSVFRGGRSPIR
jgi:hypothetical protein